MPCSRAAAAAPAQSVARSGGGSTPASRRVAMSLKASSSSRASIRAARSFGRRSRIALSRIASSEPCLRSSSAAVFGPTPLAPGRPSEGSPRRAMKSGTWLGVDAVALAHLVGADRFGAFAAAGADVEDGDPLAGALVHVAVAGQQQRLAAGLGLELA